MATSSQSYDRRRRISAALRRLMPSGGHTWTVPVITLLLLLGLVAGAVIMSTVTRRHVQLDDGTVWVTSLKNQKAARFNVKNKEADAGVSSSAPRFDIAQHNGDTILTENDQKALPPSRHPRSAPVSRPTSKPTPPLWSAGIPQP